MRYAVCARIEQIKKGTSNVLSNGRFDAGRNPAGDNAVTLMLVKPMFSVRYDEK
jgi:hypothetical protein